MRLLDAACGVLIPQYYYYYFGGGMVLVYAVRHSVSNSGLNSSNLLY